ncbi:MAG: hypothetical protein HKP48_07705 [Winogradskyella sp.]|uniref:immunity 53 family protein n=1 Tax=Winogradskyella sp. TaxID=1883156 RepID=UPI0017C43C2A|nr:immunity 53 family protein [Winogradskyella sp.]MBT8244748.1 immunity 53 family protein [Winogradskyella sp.]NNK23166.1 hypothetical protein [Winogradskyella sp.]
MDILNWIEDWLTQNCDGDWEKNEIIQITNIDNPGWEVEIDISKTSVANLEVKWILNEHSKLDWYGVKIENQKFTAAGDTRKLSFLLNLFREMIEKVERQD